MRFAQPAFLYLLCLVPLFAWLLAFLYRYRRKAVARFVERPLEGAVAWRFDAKRYLWKNVLLCLAMILSVLALAR
ncbi:MAG: hypothetical protein HGA80_09460, partial [Candidatus Omnitrophica bacterium]|nr:hypothetical protein [Candidatus Omnitrophota bacterium]